VNDLVRMGEAASGYTLVGSGKTAMDACTWLLDNGVAPDAIRWIRPRDAWILDRRFAQPLALVGRLIEGVSLNLEAAAQAESVDDLFRRLEAYGQLVRIDPTVEPTMYRCATVSDRELAQLRCVENVVRQGRVVHIGTDAIRLEEDSVPTDPRHVHVDCTAAGLHVAPGRPIFAPDRITLQQVRTCQPSFNAALVAFVETTRGDDAEKNRLCPPNPYPDAAVDWMAGTRISTHAESTWMRDPDMARWLERSRLNAARGIGDHLADPSVQSALTRFAANAEPAMDRLGTLFADAMG
jgi:hypothetical protein